MISHESVKREAAAGRSFFPPRQPKDWAGVAGRENEGRAADCEEDADEREQQANLPQLVLRRERRRAQELGRDAARQEEYGGHDHERERERAAERVADDRRDVVELQVLDAPAILDGAGG